MLSRVLKVVRFTVKKEVGKVVETLGESGGAQEFRKVGARAPEVEKGPIKGPPKFSKFRFLRLSKTL